MNTIFLIRSSVAPSRTGQNKQISKEALLAHSKRFQKAMEKNNVGCHTQTLSALDGEEI